MKFSEQETNCPYYEYHDWSKGTPSKTKNVRVCVLNARKSKKRFCSYLNDNFDCTAPTHEYDYCIGFLKD